MEVENPSVAEERWAESVTGLDVMEVWRESRWRQRSPESPESLEGLESPEELADAEATLCLRNSSW